MSDSVNRVLPTEAMDDSVAVLMGELAALGQAAMCTVVADPADKDKECVILCVRALDQLNAEILRDSMSEFIRSEFISQLSGGMHRALLAPDGSKLMAVDCAASIMRAIANDSAGHGQSLMMNPPPEIKQMRGMKGIAFGIWTTAAKAVGIHAAFDAILHRFAIDSRDATKTDAGGPPTAG